MKFRLTLLAMVSAALLAANGAAAFVDPPAPGTWKSLTQCLTNGAMTQSSGQYLRFAWGSLTEAQAYNFLDAQSWTMTLTGPGPGGNTATYGQNTGDTSAFTVPTRITQPNQNGGKPFWLTALFFPINMPTGTYTLSLTTSLAKTSFDGTTVYQAGTSWFTVSGCTLIVT